MLALARGTTRHGTAFMLVTQHAILAFHCQRAQRLQRLQPLEQGRLAD